MFESQLFRAYGAPAAADRIRNPGHRPTYSYGLASFDIQEFARASMAHFSATVRDFHNKIINKKGKRHVIYRKSYFIIQRLRSHGTPDRKKWRQHVCIFSRNPRGGNAKATDPADVAKFQEIAREHEFGKIVAHAPYTLNACAAKENLRGFSRNTFSDDLNAWKPHQEIIIISIQAVMWDREFKLEFRKLQKC